jgi:hypothetical protein
MPFFKSGFRPAECAHKYNVSRAVSRISTLPAQSAVLPFATVRAVPVAQRIITLKRGKIHDIEHITILIVFSFEFNSDKVNTFIPNLQKF